MSFINEEQHKIIDTFIKFVSDELKLKKTPPICLQNVRDGIKTTAVYDYSNNQNKIRIYGKNRAIVDILRSIGHEMVHHKQFEDGRLKIKPEDVGGDIEDEANAKSGQYIKMFAKIKPEIYN